MRVVFCTALCISTASALRVAAQPVSVPPRAATAEACVTANDIGQHPQLRTLWRQARAGAAARGELMARYKYSMWTRQEGREHKPDGPTQVVTRAFPPVVSDPTSALTNEAIRRAQLLSSGFYGPNDGWTAPTERDVLHEDFLEAHCLYPDATRGAGEVGIRFRPLQPRRNFLDIGGTLWLDSATYRARRLEVEFVDGEESRGTYRLDFTDVPVASGVVRMPAGGPYDLRPSRTDPAKHVSGKLTQRYSDFSEGSPLPVTPDHVDAFVEAEMARRHIPGLSLAVVKAGTIVKAKGYGLADVKRGERVTPETVFRIASVSKQFVAAGIMLLAQDGKLAIDDPVSKHLPRPPSSWDSITLRHLLTHTSGMPRESPAYMGSKVLADSVILQSAYGQALLFPPGTSWTYSNLGYFVLADVISRTSGTRWDEFLTQRVFAPQGMTSTRTRMPLSPARARGYFWHDKGFLRKAGYTIAGNSLIVRPSGGYYSTALDLANWDAALYRDDVLPRASREAMWTPVRLTTGTPHRYGFGWFVDVVDGHRRVSHSGGVSGFSSQVTRFVDDSLTVIVLTNKEGEGLDGVADQIARAFVPALRPKP
jgi:D-alanyl-D-alanine carboxypeptidase